MKKAIGYVRVSTMDQGISVDMQPDRIRKYCEYNDIKLVGIIIDEDISGGVPVDSRPGGSKILPMILSGEVNCVVSLKLDRLFRSTTDALLTTEVWNKYNVSLHVVDMGGISVNTSSSIGKLFLTMLSSFAEFERNVISERTVSALKHKKERGERTGRVSFGYVDVAGKLVEDPEDMTIVREMFRLHADGVSLNEISRRVSKAGGKQFYASSVKCILKNSLHKFGELKNVT